MAMENESVFSLVTRLCERFLDRKERKHGCSSRSEYLKKLRSISYGILLKPVDSAFSDNPHECFVNAISAHIHNGIEKDQIYTEEFDRCIENLWLESSKKPFIASIVHFLSKLHNESLSLDSDLQDAYNSDSQYSEIRYNRCSLPKKYRTYHPSLFTLPKLENYVVRDSKFLCSASIPKSSNNQAVVHSSIGLQLNFNSKKEDNKRKVLSSQMNSLLHLTQDPGDDYGHQLEDEGYVSHGATPLGVSPGGLHGMQWDEIGLLDKASEKKYAHRTWESLGAALPARERPTLMEAGAKALFWQLKIQECLILTMEPSIWSPPKNSTSWHSFFKAVMYLLIGVESECFTFNKKLDAFEFISGTWVEGLSHEALALYSHDFIVMGTCFKRLTAFLDPTTCSEYSEGIIQQVLKGSMKTYLNLHSGACMVVMESLLKKSSLSFLLVKSKIRILQQNIIGLARAFGKWGGGNTIPSGVGALGHLYRHAYGTQRKEVVYLLRYILNSACRAYFHLVERWVYNGEVVDEDDFFVVARVEYISYRSRRYWTRAFTVKPSSVPEFLSGLQPLLLRCGKSMHFLKLCDPKNAVLEEALNLKGCKSEQMTSMDKDEADPSLTVGQCASVPIHPTEPTIMGSADDPHQPLQDSLTAVDDVGAINEKQSDEMPGDKTDLLGDDSNDSQEHASKNVERLPLSLTVSEEEFRFKAVRESIIDEYTNSLQALDKRYVRADWRKRRLLLRTQKRTPAQPQMAGPKLSQTDSQTLLLSNPIKEHVPQKMEKIYSDNTEPLVSDSENERVSEIESHSTVLTDAQENVKGGNDLTETSPREITAGGDTGGDLKLSEEDKNLRDIEINGTSEKNLGGSTEKMVGGPCANVGSVSHNQEELLVHLDAIDKRNGEESESGQDTIDAQASAGNEGNDESGKVLELPTTADCKMDSCADDVFFFNLISLPPTSASVSPRRTPLKKVDGLFSLPKASYVSGTEENSAEAEEAEQFDWPFRRVLVSLISHSQKVDAALLRWFLMEKGLISHLHSLRAYFFLLDGEFGRRLSEDLFSAMGNKPGKKPNVQCLNTVTLNSILSHALASSTHAISDPNASLLSMTLRSCSAQASAIEQLGSIHMVYDAPWPLNVVLTDEALSKYSRVLDLLLRLKYGSWALEDAFMHMRIIDPSKGNEEAFSGVWRSSSAAFHHSPQYRKLHVYRHQMLNLIKSIQSYITAEVLQASGKKLEDAIAHSSCLDEFYAEHVSYVKRILFGCLLNKRSETISTIVDDILKLIMKFHWSLCSRSWLVSQDQVNGESFNLIHPNFSVLSRIHNAFQEMTEFLLKYAWRLAHHGYQAHLNNLLLMVNANNFYKLKNEGDNSGKDTESSVPAS